MQENSHIASPTQFRLQAHKIRPAFEAKKKSDPGFKGMTCAMFATQRGIGESTWKKLYSGQATDAMCSTVWAIAPALGLDLYELFGLDPNQKTHGNEPFDVVEMRRQIAADAERIRFKDERIRYLEGSLSTATQEQDRLRKMYHEEALKRTRAEEHAAALDELVKERNESINKHDKTQSSNLGIISHLTTANRRNRWYCIIISLITIALAVSMIYLLWELQNPDAGYWQY